MKWALTDGTQIDFYANNLTDQIHTNYGFDGTGFGVGEVYQIGAGRELGISLSRAF